MATANPAMSEAVYRRAGLATMRTRVMTLQGSVLKTAALLITQVLPLCGGLAHLATGGGQSLTGYKSRRIC